jgi:CRP-like cAMP-binding protein
MPIVDSSVRSNQLIAAFPAASQKRLAERTETFRFELKSLVCEAGTTIKHAYFPQECVLSLLTVLENGSAIETANIGREGAFGLFPAMYGHETFNRCIVQFEGTMLRCPVEVIHEEFRGSEEVRNLIINYSETLMSQVQQTVACNALHGTEERMARWLLMMDDRANGETLAYTHDFLAHILGANRKSVTLAAQSMQEAGVITYKRGHMQVRDRRGLEAVSCECYAVVQRRFKQFLRQTS